MTLAPEWLEDSDCFRLFPFYYYIVYAYSSEGISLRAHAFR